MHCANILSRLSRGFARDGVSMFPTVPRSMADLTENHHCTKERQGERRRKEKQGIRLMEEILHQRICSLSHYLQYFIDSRWCRISSINSMKRIDMEKIQEAREVKRIQSRSRPKTANRWTYWKLEVNDENKFQKLNKNKQTRITTRTTIAIMNNIIIVYNEVQKRGSPMGSTICVEMCSINEAIWRNEIQKAWSWFLTRGLVVYNDTLLLLSTPSAECLAMSGGQNSPPRFSPASSPLIHQYPSMIQVRTGCVYLCCVYLLNTTNIYEYWILDCLLHFWHFLHFLHLNLSPFS